MGDYDLNTSNSLQSALRVSMEARLDRVKTAIPAEVTAYFPADRSAQVRPLVNLEDGTAFPVSPKVPVAFPRGGGFQVVWPLVAGDTGVLVYCERDIEQWVTRGGAQNPGSDRVFDLSDAVFMPGASAYPSYSTPASATDLVIGREDGSLEIRVTPAGKVSVGSATVDVLSILDQLMDAILTASFAPGIDPATAATIGAPVVGLIDQLATIKV